MRIQVDEQRCCAGGQCVLAAPELFDQRDDDGIVVVLNENPAPDQYDAARDAAQICPAAAIALLDDDA
jgi:ferredoxin